MPLSPRALVAFWRDLARRADMGGVNDTVAGAYYICAAGLEASLNLRDTLLDELARKAYWCMENGATNENADVCEDVLRYREAMQRGEQEGGAEEMAEAKQIQSDAHERDAGALTGEGWAATAPALAYARGQRTMLEVYSTPEPDYRREETMVTLTIHAGRAARPMDAGHGWGARAMELALAEHGIALEPPDDIEAIGRSLERILLRDDTPPYRMGAESHNPRDVSILGGDPSL